MSKDKKSRETNPPEERTDLIDLMNDTISHRDKGLSEVGQSSSGQSLVNKPQTRQSHSTKAAMAKPAGEKKPLDPKKDGASKKPERPDKPKRKAKENTSSSNKGLDSTSQEKRSGETTTLVVTLLCEGELSIENLQNQAQDIAHKPYLETSPRGKMESPEQVMATSIAAPAQPLETHVSTSAETKVAGQDDSKIQVQPAVEPEKVNSSAVKPVSTPIMQVAQRAPESAPKEQGKTETPIDTTIGGTALAQNEVRTVEPPAQQTSPAVSVESDSSNHKLIGEQAVKIKQLSAKLSNRDKELAAARRNLAEKDQGYQEIVSQLKIFQQRLEILESKISQGNLALESKDVEIKLLKSQIETTRDAQALEVAVHFGHLLQTFSDLAGQDPEKTEGLSLLRIYHTLQDVLQEAIGIKPTRFPNKSELCEDEDGRLVVTLDADVDGMSELQQKFDWSPEKPFEGRADGQKKRNFRLLHWGWRLGKKVIAPAIISVLPEPEVSE